MLHFAAIYLARMIFLAADTNINVPIWAFLSLVISAIGVPLITSWIRSREKKLDWKRQDEVARRAEVAAVEVTGAAKLLVESNAEVAKAALENTGKIAEIHHMVDGQMTITMQEALDSKIASLVLMEEVVAHKDGEPSPQTTATMRALKVRIDELTRQISERHALAGAATAK